MNRILPHPLWIGHADDGRDNHAVFQEGIRAAVQLALEEPSIRLPRDLIYLRFPLLDGGGNDRELLRLAIASVARMIAAKIPTLVLCSAGMSRSPAIAAAALAVATGGDFKSCLQLVVQHRPADVSGALLAEISGLFESPPHFSENKNPGTS